jgi:hypothetical protein
MTTGRTGVVVGSGVQINILTHKSASVHEFLIGPRHRNTGTLARFQDAQDIVLLFRRFVILDNTDVFRPNLEENDPMIQTDVEEVSRCAQGSVNPAYVVTLVHGTFARGAKWTRPWSIMWEALEDNLKEVDICYCDWSGMNTHQARIDAAEGVKKHMFEMATMYPLSKHFVVAHSHGGNVVLYALRDETVRNAVAGVITMGTPFVTCRPRLLTSTMTFISYVIGTFSGGLLAGLWIAASQHWFPELGVVRIGGLKSGSPLLGFGLGLALWVGTRTLKAVRLHLAAWIRLKQEELSKRFSTGFFDHPPFLCATVDGDEPRRWLSAVGAVSGFPALLFAVKARMLGVGTVLTTVVIGFMSGHHSVKWLGGAVLYNLVIAWSGLCLYQFFAIFLPRTVRAHRYAFGGESILDNWLNDITISVAPDSVGLPTDMDDLGPSPATGLAHSSFYTDKAFIERMCTWIKATSVASVSPQNGNRPSSCGLP